MIKIADKNIAWILSANLTFGLISACTTPSTSESQNKKDILSSSAAYSQKEKIIQQAGAISTLDYKDRPDFYAQLRKSNDLHQKIAGLISSGEWESASGELKLYLRDHPGDLWGLGTLAAALTLGRQYDHAAFYAQLALAKSPHDADAMNIMAISYVYRESTHVADYKKSLEYLESVFASHGDHLASGMNLAEIYLTMGKNQKAKEVFSRILERKPSFTFARIGYAISSVRTHDYDEAMKALKIVQKSEPSNPKVLYHLALLSETQFGAHKDAENYLKNILSLADSDSSVAVYKKRANYFLRNMQTNSSLRDIKTEEVAKKSETKEKLTPKDQVAPSEQIAPKEQEPLNAKNQDDQDEKDQGNLIMVDEEENAKEPNEDPK